MYCGAHGRYISDHPQGTGCGYSNDDILPNILVCYVNSTPTSG